MIFDRLSESLFFLTVVSSIIWAFLRTYDTVHISHSMIRQN